MQEVGVGCATSPPYGLLFGPRPQNLGLAWSGETGGKFADYQAASVLEVSVSEPVSGGGVWRRYDTPPGTDGVDGLRGKKSPFSRENSSASPRVLAIQMANNSARLSLWAAATISSNREHRALIKRRTNSFSELRKWAGSSVFCRAKGLRLAMVSFPSAKTGKPRHPLTTSAVETTLPTSPVTPVA